MPAIPTCRPWLSSCARPVRPSATAARMVAAVAGRSSCSSELFACAPVAWPPASPAPQHFYVELQLKSLLKPTYSTSLSERTAPPIHRLAACQPCQSPYSSAAVQARDPTIYLAEQLPYSTDWPLIRALLQGTPPLNLCCLLSHLTKCAQITP